MKKSIWKFPIPIKDDIQLVLPAKAEIISVQVQNNEPCIWAIVNTKSPTIVRHFKLLGTGYPFNLVNYKFIATFQLHAGNLVFHLFEDQGFYPIGTNCKK